MKIKEAEVEPADQPRTIREVDLTGRRCRVVPIEIKAAGIHRADYYTLSDHDPEGLRPVIPGVSRDRAKHCLITWGGRSLHT